MKTAQLVQSLCFQYKEISGNSFLSHSKKSKFRQCLDLAACMRGHVCMKDYLILVSCSRVCKSMHTEFALEQIYLHFFHLFTQFAISYSLYLLYWCDFAPITQQFSLLALVDRAYILWSLFLSYMSIRCLY